LDRSEIARLTGLSRNTVKKWLKAEGQVTPAYHPAGHPNSSSKGHSNSPTLIGL
jgi:predicted transcriptional regulator